jgi:DNA-binding NarL/FixJ family response regulator
MNTLRVLLVDDSAGFLATAQRILERDGIRVVGIATNGVGAERAARELTPDVTLVDIDLGDESGFDVVGRLADTGLRSVLISSHAPDDFEDMIASSGATGFLSKSRLSAAAVHEVLAGGAGPAT